MPRKTTTANWNSNLVLDDFLRFWMMNNDDFRNCANMSRIHRSLLSRRIQNITPSQSFCLAPVCRSDATGLLQQSRANKFSVASQSIQMSTAARRLWALRFCTRLIQLSFFFFFSSAFFLESSSSESCSISNFPLCHTVSTHNFPAMSRQPSAEQRHSTCSGDSGRAKRGPAPGMCQSFHPWVGKMSGALRPCLSPDENKQKAHHDASSRVAEWSICIPVLKGPCKKNGEANSRWLCRCEADMALRFNIFIYIYICI